MTIPIWAIGILVYLFVAYLITKDGCGQFDFASPLMFAGWTAVNVAGWTVYVAMKVMQ